MSHNSKLVKFPGPGCVVEFLHSNQPLLAFVVEEQAGKLRLFTINKREVKLPSNRLLPWSGPAGNAQASRSEMEEELSRHQAARNELMQSIDPMEIWELAQGEVTKASAEWFAGLQFDAPGPDEVAAMGRTLLESKTHFRFQPPDFEVFPADVVERRQAEQEAARVRELLVTEGHEFFKELWQWRAVQEKSGDKSGDKAGSRPRAPEPAVAEELRSILMARIAEAPSPSSDPKAEEVWTQLRKGLPEHPFLALLLAQAWGLVPPHYNFLLDRAGYEPGDDWSRRFAEEIEEHRRLLSERLGEPEDTPFVSIDSATTRDIDDAFHIVQEPDGSFKVAVALACPALTFDFDSPLGRAVAHRASSLYLPEGSYHMLPEVLGTDLYSLQQGVPRPALVMDFVLDPAGRPVTMTPRLATVSVRRNLAYTLAEEVMAGTGTDRVEPEVMATLDQGSRLAAQLRARRLERGAVVIERPEPKITLEQQNGETRVELGLTEPTPRSQLLVSEMMILVNMGAAIWAGEHDVPLLYRTQEVSMPAELAGVWERPEDIHRVVRQMSCTVMEPRPAPHASLAVPAYSPVSSPLRRYPDLVNLGQIVGMLRDGRPLFDRAELERRLPEISARGDAVGQIQRFRPRYWKLVYFRERQKKETWQSMVVEEGQLVTVSVVLAQIYLRAPRDFFGDRIYLGQSFRLKLGKIDPLTNELKIAEAWEE